MKVIVKDHQIIEKELNLEYPIYLNFQDEMCDDIYIKLFHDKEIIIERDYFGFSIKTNYYPQYTENAVLNNLTTEEAFNNTFEEALKQLIEVKSGL